jgi:hypothetical protein
MSTCCVVPLLLGAAGAQVPGQPRFGAGNAGLLRRLAGARRDGIDASHLPHAVDEEEDVEEGFILFLFNYCCPSRFDDR